MMVSPIKTDRIEAGKCTLDELVRGALRPDMLEDNIVVLVTSKIVSLCESSVVPIADVKKDDLIMAQSEYYLDASTSQYGIQFTVTDGMLIPSAGIDESNGGDNFVLWPENPQRSANELRQFLTEQYGYEHIGVIITDSTCHPLRRGTVGVAIAYSGIAPLNDYVGKPDLFGRAFTVSQADIASGLAASAVTAMGEGAESTPICLIKDVPFVQFVTSDPSEEELAYIRITKEEDLFGPFLQSVKWESGRKKRN